VLAIKQTLYRVGQNSPIVKALMDARERGKQVTVLVELKARFDEENNITWARALERSGVHVVYGVLGLKTHAKVALVVRQEKDVIRRYVHLGTGNYNSITARVYTDLGLLTAREEFGADASELFNFLTGHSRQKGVPKAHRRAREYARKDLRADRSRGSLRRDDGRRKADFQAQLDRRRPGHRLPAACFPGRRQGGPDRPRNVLPAALGFPSKSERIYVRSIVGPFLEHSRIFYFQNGGKEEVYIGSADLMERNLYRAWRRFSRSRILPSLGK
jgi:polyphosphate kinase